MKQALILVSGMPGVGKTTLGKKISQEFNLIFVYKDAIKEILFNSLGVGDLVWNKKLGSAGYDILYYFTGEVLGTGQSLVLESNFTKDYADKKMAELKKQYNCEVIQIYCTATEEALLERYKKRISSGKRHPGHIDMSEDIHNRFKDPFLYKIAVKKTIEVDLTDFPKVNYAKIAEEVKSLIR